MADTEKGKPEESVLMAADKVAEDAKDQDAKTLVNLFKSVVL